MLNSTLIVMLNSKAHQIMEQKPDSIRNHYLQFNDFNRHIFLESLEIVKISPWLQFPQIFAQAYPSMSHQNITYLLFKSPTVSHNATLNSKEDFLFFFFFTVKENLQLVSLSLMQKTIHQQYQFQH